MMEKLRQAFRFRPGEAGLVFVLGAMLFANYAAMGITKVISVSGFLSQVKDHYILLVWAVDMVLLILATGLQSLVVDRFDRIKLMLVVLLVFTGLYAVLPLTFLNTTFPLSISYTLIYLLNDQQWRFFPVLFWILVNDIFDPAAGRRLLPIIANFAFVGTIVGLAVGGLDARLQFGPVMLLYLNAAIFLTGFVIAYFGLRKVRLISTTRTGVSMKETFAEGWNFIKTVPSFAYVAFGMLTAGTIMTILLYDTLSDAKLDLGNGFQAFYANYNLLMAVGSILVQTFAGRVIDKLGLKNGFFIQPFVMLAATLTNFFIPGFLSSSSAQGVARVSYETVDQSNRKAFQAMVPNEKRGRVSLFIDSYLPSLGTIVGSLITFGIVVAGLGLGLTRGVYGLIYLGVGVALAALSIWAAFRIRKTYDESMLNWQLKRRTRGSSGVLDKLDFSDGEK
jgi:ATP:ADP antiporter, AAA family